MKNTVRSTRSLRRRGSAIIEFALTSAVFLALCMGAADFSRALYHAIVLTDAATNGATYGALRLAHSGRISTMRNLVDTSSQDLSGEQTVSSTAERFCDCPAAPADRPGHANAVSCTTGSCAGYGQPRTYVRVRGSQSFRTVGTYPLIPSSFGLGQATFRRVY